MFDDATKPPPPRTIRQQMIGMTESEIPVCLGEPKKIIDHGSSQVWSYKYGSCGLDLTLQRKIVIADSFTIKADDDHTEDEQCQTVPEVGGCLRWLRKPFAPE